MNRGSKDSLPSPIRKTLTGLFGAMLVCLLFAHPVRAASPQIERMIGNIERNLEANRNRQALTDLSILRRALDPESLSPRVFLLEAKVLLANGLPTEARDRIDYLRGLPDPDDEIVESEILLVELDILKSTGKSVEALYLLESQLPGLDEIDPPYSEEVTEMFHTYADLLFVCSQYSKAVDVVFDTIERGAPQGEPERLDTLLRFAERGAFRESDFDRLPEIFENHRGAAILHRFAFAAFEAGKEDLARELFSLELDRSALALRAFWPRFLETAENEAFLTLAADLLFEHADNPDSRFPEHSRTMGALTFEELGRGEEALERIKEHMDRDLDLQFFAARIYAAQGRIDEASGVYAALEKKRPGGFLEPWGKLLADYGETDSALAIWKLIPERGNHRTASYRRLGGLLKNRGFLEESKDAYMEGIEKTGNADSFANDLLEVSLALSDVEGALLAYQSLREKNRRNQYIWTPGRLVEQLRQTQQLESFSAALERVLEASSTVQAVWRDFAVELQTDLALRIDSGETFLRWIEDAPPAVVAYWNSTPLRKSEHLMSLGLELSLLGEHSLASRVFDEVEGRALLTRMEALEAAARSNANVERTTRAIELWGRVRSVPIASPHQKERAALALARLHIDNYEPGKGLQWLDQVPTDLRSPSTRSEYLFLQGLAYTRLHDTRKAIAYLRKTVEAGRAHSARAMYWLAEWELWQRNRDKALEAYSEILRKDPGQELANDALWRLRHLGSMTEEDLPDYCLAAFFEAGGEWEKAEANYRRLASQTADIDLLDWIYFRIGKIFVRTGRREEGFEQWNVVLEKTQNPTLARRIRYEMAALSETPKPNDREVLEDLVLESPDSLIGDLAREKMRTIAKQPAPETEEPAEDVVVP